MKYLGKSLGTLFATSAILAALSAPAVAASVTFTGSGTNGASGGSSNVLSAKVVFDDALLATLGQLKITLTNTGPGATVPSDVLTAVLWDYTGPGTFAYPPISLFSATAATVIGGTPGTNVDLLALGEWKLPNSGTGAADLPGVTQNIGLGTAGLGIFQGGGGQQFNYGIISGYDSPNPAVSNGTFVDDEAIFVLAGVPLNIDITTFANVRFQFGTSLTEPSVPGTRFPPAEVPEPSTYAMMLAGLGMLGFMIRRRSR